MKLKPTVAFVIPTLKLKPVTIIDTKAETILILTLKLKPVVITVLLTVELKPAATTTIPTLKL
jgi:hypothetical protein